MNAEGAPLAVWARLRDDPRLSTTSDIPSVETDVRTAAGAVRLALGEDSEARLLIPLSDTEPFPRLLDAGGLTVQDRYFVVSERVRFLDVVCRKPALERVFSDLTSAVLTRLAESQPAGQALQGAIRDFRELLLAAAASDVSLAKALGLIGELSILNLLLASDPDAWSAWTGGTFSARHDFRAGDAALEIKCGLRRPSLAVEISALDQLLEPDGGRLHLIHVIVERDPVGPMHVEALAQMAVGRASDPEAVLELLADRDYRPALAQPWSEFRFSPYRRDIYRVTEGFPRLVPADFVHPDPPGISHFSYRVDLSGAAPFRLEAGAEASVFADLLEQLS